MRLLAPLSRRLGLRRAFSYTLHHQHHHSSSSAHAQHRLARLGVLLLALGLTFAHFYAWRRLGGEMGRLEGMIARGGGSRPGGPVDSLPIAEAAAEVEAEGAVGPPQQSSLSHSWGTWVASLFWEGSDSPAANASASAPDGGNGNPQQHHHSHPFKTAKDPQMTSGAVLSAELHLPSVTNSHSGARRTSPRERQDQLDRARAWRNLRRVLSWVRLWAGASGVCWGLGALGAWRGSPSLLSVAHTHTRTAFWLSGALALVVLLLLTINPTREALCEALMASEGIQARLDGLIDAQYRSRGAAVAVAGAGAGAGAGPRLFILSGGPTLQEWAHVPSAGASASAGAGAGAGTTAGESKSPPEATTRKVFVELGREQWNDTAVRMGIALLENLLMDGESCNGIFLSAGRTLFSWGAIVALGWLLALAHLLQRYIQLLAPPPPLSLFRTGGSAGADAVELKRTLASARHGTYARRFSSPSASPRPSTSMSTSTVPPQQYAHRGAGSGSGGRGGGGQGRVKSLSHPLPHTARTPSSYFSVSTGTGTGAPTHAPHHGHGHTHTSPSPSPSYAPATAPPPPPPRRSGSGSGSSGSSASPPPHRPRPYTTTTPTSADAETLWPSAGFFALAGTPAGGKARTRAAGHTDTGTGTSTTRWAGAAAAGAGADAAVAVAVAIDVDVDVDAGAGANADLEPGTAQDLPLVHVE